MRRIIIIAGAAILVLIAGALVWQMARTTGKKSDT